MSINELKLREIAEFAQGTVACRESYVRLANMIIQLNKEVMAKEEKMLEDMGEEVITEMNLFEGIV